jgi:glycogen operon protein
MVGRSFPIGATPTDTGVNFSIFSRYATGVELLFYEAEDDAQPSRVIRLDPVSNRTYHYWHIFVKDARPGQIYAYRIEGPLRTCPRISIRFHETPPRSVRPWSGDT